MSLLTKTALIYASYFAILLLFMAPAASYGGPISDAFAEIIKGGSYYVASAGLVALIAEGLHRTVSRLRSRGLSSNVPFLQIVAQLFMVNYTLSLVIEHAMMGISYLLLALFMGYTFWFLKKEKKSALFWLTNACCASVIGITHPTAFVFVVMTGQAHGDIIDGAFSISRIVFSALLIGVPSYLNYRKLTKSETT